MLCILYVNAVGALLGIAGRLVERVLPASFARRWVWAVIIPISLFVPGYYRGHHAAAVGTTPLPALNDGFWYERPLLLTQDCFRGCLTDRCLYGVPPHSL